MKTNTLFFTIIGSMLGTGVFSFAPLNPSASSAVSSVIRPKSLLYAEGFGAPKPAPREKSEAQKKRDMQSSKYDDIASSGGQQYNVYVRQFGSDDKSWLPCGSIAVPRGAQVSDAVFANEEGLKSAIIRTYPKLKGFEEEFEFGFNLKIYPDDPIDVAVKGSGSGSASKEGFSVGNWISTLLSPIDASGVQQMPSNDK